MTDGSVAAVDIGTNSVRLLIVDAAGREVDRRMKITRLGQGVDETGLLHPDAIARTTDVLAEYGVELARHRVTRVRATATSAARDAGNRDAFFDAAERALGVRPELLPASQEARFSFLGATVGLPVADGPFLVVDIGGGSTEFVLGSTEPEALISVKMGCVRMTERHLRSDPPTAAQLEACRADVRETLAAVREAIDVRRARLMVGLAGTVTTLASLEQGLKKYAPTKTHHSRLTRSQVEAMLERLSVLDIEGRRALLAEPERASVIVGGAVVLATLLRELDIPELLVSESDILDGLAASLRLTVL